MELSVRILNRRLHGRSAFLDILANGENIQAYINTDVINFSEIVSLPIGSFIRIIGEYFLTRSGHSTIRIESVEIIYVPNRTLPVMQDNGENRFNELTTEGRRRRRYIQTIIDPIERQVFITRSAIINLIRNFFIQREYLEVETPILQPIYGGAEANPFITRFESLDSNFYLRIAPEMYLRRLIIGGYDRVFEIGRNFRNEGISNRHNPEFTFIEIYTAFENYMFSMNIIRDLFLCIHQQFGAITYQGNVIDFSTIESRRYFDLVDQYCGIDISRTEIETINLFETIVEPNLINPIMVYDYPASISPLAQVRSDNPNIAERFEIYIGGMEIGNAYSELNDVSQHIENVGTEDVDFIEALEYGMPPTTGIGLGIDRIVMLLTNRPIRDVIYFPAMRQEN